MKTSWFQGTKDKDYNEEIRGSFTAAVVMRKRLNALLQRKQVASVKASRLEGGYDNPNWALKQADARGYERALEEVISLLEE